MKKALKKIAAVAMAFTLLGSGAAITKSVSPKATNSITAYAGMPSQYCEHKYGKHIDFVGNYHFDPYCDHGAGAWDRFYYICCNRCGTPLSGRKIVVKSSIIAIINWAVNYDGEHR